jgi:hypothetical protein
MCRNLNLGFLLFYCLVSKFFPVSFHLFFLAFYCLFSFCRIGFSYRPSFSPFFFDIVLFLFIWLMWFHLYPTPTYLGLKSLVIVVVVAALNEKAKAVILQIVCGYQRFKLPCQFKPSWSNLKFQTEYKRDQLFDQSLQK